MKAPQRGSNDRSLAAPTLVLFRRRLVQCHNRVRFLTEAPHERSGRCGASAVVTAGSDRSPAADSAVIFCAHISHRKNVAAEIPRFALVTRLRRQSYALKAECDGP